MSDKDFNMMKPWGMMARCVMNPDHSIAYFLNQNDSNLKEDGTPVDWEEVEELGQNVMVQIPKFYFVKKKMDDRLYFGVADKPVEDDYISIDEWMVHPAFYRDRSAYVDDTNAEPVEVDYRYVGAFDGWVDDKGRLRSLPHKPPTVDKTIGEFRNYAKNMGVGWTQFDYNLLYAIQMLYITEFGHPDSQTHIGRGFVDGNSARINTGGTLDKGNNTFGEETGKVQMSYRGVEDLWGNIENFVDGFILNRPSQGDISIANKGFNNSGIGYDTIGTASNLMINNIREIRDEVELGFIPVATGGSNDSDGLYASGRLNVSSAARFALCGGSWAAGSVAGTFFFYASLLASDSTATRGTRLCL